MTEANQKPGRIFIHCKGGQGRSCAMTLAWYIHSGMNPRKAIEKIYNARNVVSKRVINYPSVQQIIKDSKQTNEE